MNYLIDKIQTELKAGLGTKVQYYLYGKPQEAYPKVMLDKGVLAIYPIGSNTEITSTNRDETTYSIGIEVIKNVQFLVYQNMKVIDDSEMIKIIEDFTDAFTLKSDTIRGILRANYNAIGQRSTFSVTYKTEERDSVALAQASIVLTIDDLLTQNYG